MKSSTTLRTVGQPAIPPRTLTPQPEVKPPTTTNSSLSLQTPATPPRFHSSPQTWVSPAASRPLIRAVRGNSKVRAFLRQLGHMVRENPNLKQGFSDNDFYNIYMNDSKLPRTTTYLPWGWAGLVPKMEKGKWRYSNTKGGTFNGICPLVRLGPKSFAFTDVAWEAMLPVLEELAANPVELQAEKNRVLRSLREKRKRPAGTIQNETGTPKIQRTL